MKKFALSVAALCGLGFAGMNTASAGDWHGNHYHGGHNHVPVVKKYDPFCATPVYNSRWNDSYYSAPIVRKPVYSSRWDDCYDSHYDYRRPSKGVSFSTPGVNFWYGR